MATYQFDVLIIGSGIAGLTAAARLAESGRKIAVITREADPNETNTNYAQGGIVFLQEDDTAIFEDIQRASSNTSNIDAVEILKQRSGEILKQILIEKARTQFTREDGGALSYTREAAHSKNRILYKGDYTGREIQISLLNYLKDINRFPNVSILPSHTAIDLLTPAHSGVRIQQRYENNRVVGAYVFNQKAQEVIRIHAACTILATGGVGALYLHHSNSEGARGDGHAMAFRAGAEITNMEFIQFHPTTYFDRSAHRRFLISEAVRGEGGKLINASGVAFMEKYHHDLELAPRDVVARAIVEEMIATKHECVYLDISHKDHKWIIDRFPTIYKHCKENHLDITNTPIPVVPAAHYTCGGIKTDLRGRTTLKCLYAVGEVACTGLHGANRLASTSLLEGLTWGYLAAEDILKHIDEVEIYPNSKIKDWESVSGECDLALVQQDLLSLKQTMWNYVGLTRSTDRLNRARAMFRELHEEIQKFYKNSALRDELIGLRNAVEAGMMVLNASRRNKESVGCFYRKN